MPLTILEIEPGQCRWPVGRGPHNSHLLCADPTGSRGSYCCHHAAQARGNGTAGERLAGKFLRQWAAGETRLSEAAS